MAEKHQNQKPFEIPRPVFPKRAVVTGGMPYGNKELHWYLPIPTRVSCATESAARM